MKGKAKLYFSEIQGLNNRYKADYIRFSMTR